MAIKEQLAWHRFAHQYVGVEVMFKPQRPVVPISGCRFVRIEAHMFHD